MRKLYGSSVLCSVAEPSLGIKRRVSPTSRPSGVDVKGHDLDRQQARVRRSISEFEVAASERRRHPVLDTALPVAGAAPAASVQQHEVQPGAIPKASFMEAALLSGDGSRLPVASRNRCGVYDLTDLSDNRCGGVRERMVLDSQGGLPPRTPVEITPSCDLYYINPIELLWNCQQSFQADSVILKAEDQVIGSGTNLGQFDRKDIN